MNRLPSKAIIDRLREEYPKGTRIQLITMEDPHTTLRRGDRGTVQHVDDIGTYEKLADMKSCY